MSSTVQFHHRLNPKLWQNNKLKPVVRLKLFQAAVAFYKFLEVDRLLVTDIIFTGSNAAFNYTSQSDLDVHLIVDFSRGVCPELAENFFTAKKSLWGETHDVTIYGYPVELYVEDVANPVKASGVYSLLHDRWLKQPSPQRPAVDDTAVRLKRDAWAAKIEDLLSGQPSLRQINQMLKRLKAMRQSGLERGGEFSVENMTVKQLRSSGLIAKLFHERADLIDRKLSL
jgi:hypothetical protein